MRMTVGSLELVTVLFLMLIACSFGSVLGTPAPTIPPAPAATFTAQTAPASPTAPASAREQPSPTAGPHATVTEPTFGKILFQDDFSKESDAWTEVQLPSLGLDHVAGEYRVVIKQTNIASWSLLHDQEFTNASVEADARLVAGSSTSSFGLMCRAAADPDLESGYEFLITPSGAAAIVKITGKEQGQQTVLSHGSATVIQSGTATNHLRMDCVDDHIAAYVNGRWLVTVRDFDYQRGRAGFAFGANPGNPGFELHYDNFVVRQVLP